jgi:hypothetical protein
MKIQVVVLFSALNPGQKFILPGPEITAETPAFVFMKMLHDVPGYANCVNLTTGLQSIFLDTTIVIPIGFA